MKLHEHRLPLEPVASAEGVWFHDHEGRRLLDGISSWWGKTNATQVQRVRTIIEALSLQVATPDETRAMLKLKGRDQVAF